MNNTEWNEKIKKNFDNAAINYLDYSTIQKFFAAKIVSYMKELSIEKGEWIDLGAGTGLLADEIEKEFPPQEVSRIDFSRKMLFQNKLSSKKILWDLNYELPSSINNCDLITSNFCIHWLKEPEKILKSWFNKLNLGGYLIISYPTKECFPEWIETCRITDIEYSGLNFISPKKLRSNFKSDEIVFSKNFSYLENFNDVYKLFRSIVNVGAHSSKHKKKTVRDFKKMQKFWPKNLNNTVNLSWQIHIQIFKRK